MIEQNDLNTAGESGLPDTGQLHLYLRTRRSVRRFIPRKVSHSVIDRILETAVWAPSAHNRQPWRFAVLTDPGIKNKLARDMGAAFENALRADDVPEDRVHAQVTRSYNRIMQAPVVIILCLSMRDMDDYPDRKRRRAEFRMAVQSAALAGGQLLLAAHAEGLGGVWVCAPLFAQDEVQQALELPDDWEPQGMLLLGYPENVPPPRARTPVHEVTQYYHEKL